MEVPMSDSNKKKQDFYISTGETAVKLRALADELERGVVTINDQEFSLTLDTPVKMNLKARDNKFSAKLKFKLKTPIIDKEETTLIKREEDRKRQCDAAIDSKVEKYKDLKKRMSKDFKSIKKSCSEEQIIPGSDLVERFYQDSKTMCTYPNKGEEFYEAYLLQTKFLYEGFKTSNLKEMNSAIESLSQIKDDCHGRHK